MSYTRTLAQIRTSVQTYGAYENSQDITPAVLLEVINNAVVESYDLIVDRWADFYTKPSSNISLVVGTDSYALPTDFYKLRKVEIALDAGLTQWKRLYPADLDASNTFTTATLFNKNYRYRLQGPSTPLVLMPAPIAVDTIRVWYIPIAPQLSADSDAITFDTPVEHKLILHVALRDLLLRQDLDTSTVDGEIAKLTAAVKTAADGRDAEPFYLDPRGPMDDLDGWGWDRWR